jgi:TPP-dependent pyruvate/acetoin dehydrogenase alpha subunit
MVRNPVNRFRKWVERNGWWSEEEESELRSSMKKQVKVDRTSRISFFIVQHVLLGQSLYQVLFISSRSFCK